MVCPALPGDCPRSTRCWGEAWHCPASLSPGQKCCQIPLTPPGETSVCRRGWNGQSRTVPWGRSCLQAADNKPSPLLCTSCCWCCWWWFLWLAWGFGPFSHLPTILLRVLLLWRCPWPGEGQQQGRLTHFPGHQSKLSCGCRSAHECNQSFTKALHLHAQSNTDTRLMCPKETEKVFTSGIKFPAIPARHLWLWPRCTDFACFIRKMSPVLCSRVALVLPHPSFPCVPGVPTVWVRAPVANTLGFAVTVQDMPRLAAKLFFSGCWPLRYLQASKSQSFQLKTRNFSK